MDDLVFRAVSRATWTDFAALFEARGRPKSCWCMVWRAMPTVDRQRDGASRRAAMKSRIDADVPVGILGYHRGVPIAWCSIAPRETYRRLGGPDGGTVAEHVWSLACFFIRRDFRQQGLTTKLIAAAVDHAARHGATVVEAYPVDPDSPSYRFMGYADTFTAAGFRKVGRAGQRRHVMRLDLSVPTAPPAP